MLLYSWVWSWVQLGSMENSCEAQNGEPINGCHGKKKTMTCHQRYFLSDFPHSPQFLRHFWLSYWPITYRFTGGKNKHRYIIASQSDETRSRLRSIPGTPLVHLNRTVMVLEPASDATMDVKRQVRPHCNLQLLNPVCLTSFSDRRASPPSENRNRNSSRSQVIWKYWAAKKETERSQRA